MRLKYIFIGLAVFAMVLLAGSHAMALDCNATKEGILAVSPQELQFYVQQEQNTNPTPITVYVNGFAYPEGTGNATNSTSFEETVDFCWMAVKSDPWITLGGQGAIAQYLPDNIRSSFNVGVDIRYLPIYEGNSTTMYDGMFYDGSVTVYSTLSDGEFTIPVRVYVNPLRENAGEMTAATPDWLGLTLNVPVSDSMNGALYLLVEHPSLVPGHVYAYRWDYNINRPELYLFSQWGNPVQNAELLYYAQDIQNTPISIPFSEGDQYVIPYGSTTEKIKAYIPITFGGFRLIGLEGDIIVRAVVGNPDNITDWRSWRELMYYTIHVIPATGNWIVTEELDGQTYTYVNPATGETYPMMLNEQRGVLSGVWVVPSGHTQLYVSYANPNDAVCSSLVVEGYRLSTNNCVTAGGYDVYFAENSVFGLVEYLYNIRNLHLTGNDYGKLSGQWMYRYFGEVNWSFPQAFSAVKQEIVIPLDPSCNCYPVNGTVNGWATGFIVDTGAFAVLLDLNQVGYMGLVDEEGYLTDACDPNPVIVGGVGGLISAYKCYVDIELEGRLSRKNVESYLSDSWSGPGLLGMTFLDGFHVSTSADDGTMIIAP